MKMCLFIEYDEKLLFNFARYFNVVPTFLIHLYSHELCFLNFNMSDDILYLEYFQLHISKTQNDRQNINKNFSRTWIYPVFGFVARACSIYVFCVSRKKNNYDIFFYSYDIICYLKIQYGRRFTYLVFIIKVMASYNSTYKKK